MMLLVLDLSGLQILELAANPKRQFWDNPWVDSLAVNLKYCEARSGFNTSST